MRFTIMILSITLMLIFSCGKNTSKQKEREVVLERSNYEENAIVIDTNKLYLPLNLFLRVGTYDSCLGFQRNSYDTASAKAYSVFLRDVLEPNMFSDSNDKLIYRLIWLRTFNHPIIIRIEKELSNYTLFWKLTNGLGGYELGDLFIRGKREIEQEVWEQFIGLISESDFWSESPIKHVLPYEDASQWILEGRSENQYHVILRDSPLNAPCKFLIGLIEKSIIELQPDVLAPQVEK